MKKVSGKAECFDSMKICRDWFGRIWCNEDDTNVLGCKEFTMERILEDTNIASKYDIQYIYIEARGNFLMTSCECLTTCVRQSALKYA